MVLASSQLLTNLGSWLRVLSGMPGTSHWHPHRLLERRHGLGRSAGAQTASTDVGTRGTCKTHLDPGLQRLHRLHRLHRVFKSPEIITHGFSFFTTPKLLTILGSWHSRPGAPQRLLAAPPRTRRTSSADLSKFWEVCQHASWTCLAPPFGPRIDCWNDATASAVRHAPGPCWPPQATAPTAKLGWI